MRTLRSTTLITSLTILLLRLGGGSIALFIFCSWVIARNKKGKEVRLLLFMSLCLVGCTELKCKDGDVYIKNNGAWVEALYYEKNKCLDE